MLSLDRVMKAFEPASSCESAKYIHQGMPTMAGDGVFSQCGEQAPESGGLTYSVAEGSVLSASSTTPRMKHTAIERIRGQGSFALRADRVELFLTEMGGMLAPVKFFSNEFAPVEPYAIAPWAEESLPPNTPDMLVALR